MYICVYICMRMVLALIDFVLIFKLCNIFFPEQFYIHAWIKKVIINMLCNEICFLKKKCIGNNIFVMFCIKLLSFFFQFSVHHFHFQIDFIQLFPKMQPLLQYRMSCPNYLNLPHNDSLVCLLFHTAYSLYLYSSNCC